MTGTNNDRGTGFLKDAFAAETTCLAALLRSSDRIAHSGDLGEVNEQFFIDTLRHYLPNRYTVDKAIILDSRGSVSDSIDVVIFDRQYTPTLLDNDKHRYIPAEAVYAVFECKPTINKSYLEYAGKKAQSVRRLHRTSVPIPHAGGVHKPRKLFPIVAGILAIQADWSGGLGETFKNRIAELTGDYALDCGLAVEHGTFDTHTDGKLLIRNSQTHGLPIFLFRLLQKLQSLGTVPAVDWNAYAETLA